MSISTCDRALRIIPLYLEREADPIDSLETATHLVRCDACAVEADRERAVIAALKELSTPAPPKDIAAGVMARLRRLKARVASEEVLKWSAVSILLGYLLLGTSVPTPVWESGLRVLARLGELLDLDFLFSRIMDGFSHFLPAPSSFLQELAGAGTLVQNSFSFAAAGHDAALLLLFAAILSLLCCIVFAVALTVMKAPSRMSGSLLRLF